MIKLVLLAMSLLVLTSCTSESTARNAPPSAKPTEPTEPGRVRLAPGSSKLSEIRVQPVEIADMPTDEFSVPGKIVFNPNRVSKVVLPVAGQIVDVRTRFGDSVEKGEPLVAVISPDIDAAASAHLQAEASVAQAQANLTKAQNDLDRASDLFKGDAVAQKEVLNARNALTQAQVALRQAQAARDQTLRRLEMFGLKPGQLGQQVLIRAPIAGKVTEIGVVAGEYRNDLSAPLMTIADLSTVWVSAEVPESLIRLVQIGERFDVTLSAFPGEIFSSRVARIEDAVDLQMRTIEVWAELPNRNGSFRPGMFGEVRHVESLAPTPVVPAGAVIQVQGRTVLWVEDSPGNFRQVEVRCGKRVGDRVPVHQGLKAGERVVVDGAMLLRGQ